VTVDEKTSASVSSSVWHQHFGQIVFSFVSCVSVIVLRDFNVFCIEFIGAC